MNAIPNEFQIPDSTLQTGTAKPPNLELRTRAPGIWDLKVGVSPPLLGIWNLKFGISPAPPRRFSFSPPIRYFPHEESGI
jgi:hypothetical protein